MHVCSLKKSKNQNFWPWRSHFHVLFRRRWRRRWHHLTVLLMCHCGRAIPALRGLNLEEIGQEMTEWWPNMVFCPGVAIWYWFWGREEIHRMMRFYWLRPPEPNRAAALENLKSSSNSWWAVFSMECHIFEIRLDQWQRHRGLGSTQHGPGPSLCIYCPGRGVWRPWCDVVVECWASEQWIFPW